MKYSSSTLLFSFVLLLLLSLRLIASVDGQTLSLSLYTDAQCTSPLVSSPLLLQPGFPNPPTISYYNTLTYDQVTLPVNNVKCVTPSWLQSDHQSARFQCGYDGSDPGIYFLAREYYNFNNCSNYIAGTNYNVTVSFTYNGGGACGGSGTVILSNGVQFPVYGSVVCPTATQPTASSTGRNGAISNDVFKDKVMIIIVLIGVFLILGMISV